MTDYFQLLSAFAVVFLALYYYFTLHFDFWKRRGVNGPRPIPVFGNIKDYILERRPFDECVTKFYQEYRNEAIIGIFIKRTPHLILIDLDLIKDVLIKDFSMFSDRGHLVFEKTEPFSLNIVNLEAKRWRSLRTRLSPIFTSGKLKDMLPLILECSNQLENCLEKLAKEGGLLDCREIAARFTTDVIGSCAFGINMNALSNEESEFRQVGKRMFQFNLKSRLLNAVKENVPWLYSLLGFAGLQSEVMTFLTKIVTETIKYRKENNIVRPDFINLLMDLQNNPSKLEHIDVTDSLLTAQAAIFFAAGFETSATTISHALYEMALNPDIQNKLRQEIREVYAKNKGNWSYDDVRDLKYMDKIFKETLRKYPPAGTLRRRCNGVYTFKGTKVTIPADIEVTIPVYAIHRDPSYYPNPNVYDPERFNEDAVAARHAMAYIPFGDGPRNCIGARFANYQTKIGLIQILKNFRVDVCNETLIPYVRNPIARVISPARSIIVKISQV